MIDIMLKRLTKNQDAQARYLKIINNSMNKFHNKEKVSFSLLVSYESKFAWKYTFKTRSQDNRKELIWWNPCTLFSCNTEQTFAAVLTKTNQLKMILNDSSLSIPSPKSCIPNRAISRILENSNTYLFSVLFVQNLGFINIQ
jgi:hypothetical protein